MKDKVTQEQVQEREAIDGLLKELDNSRKKYQRMESKLQNALNEIQELLQKSEARLNAHLENTQDFMWSVDADFRCLEANSAFRRVFSAAYGIEPFKGMDILASMPIERRTFWSEVMRRAVLGERFTVEFRLVIRGSILDTEVSVNPIVSGNGTVEGVSFFGRNITRCRMTEEELRETEGRLQLAIEGSDAGLWDMKLDHRSSYNALNDNVYLSPQLKKIIGYEDDEFPNSMGAWQSRILPEYLHLVSQSARNHFEGGTDLHEVEYPIRHKDGTIRWIYSRGKIQRDEQGQPMRWIGIDWDITVRKQFEEALRAEKERVQKYLDIAGVMFVAINKKGVITLANRKACEIFGYEEGDLLGKNWFKTCLPKEMREAVHQVFKQLMAGETKPVEYYENPVVTKGGEERLIAWHNTLLRDDSGKIVGTLSSGEDITDRQCAEEARQENERRLKDAQTLGRIGDWEYDIENQSITWSEQVFELYEREKTLGPPTPEEEATYYSPEQCKFLRECAVKAIETGESFQYDLDVKLPSGKVALFSATVHPLTDKSGRVVKLFGTVQDITERKRAEQALQVSEERFRIASECASDLIWEWDIIGGELAWFGKIDEMLGYEEEEFPRTIEAWEKIIHPDDYNRVMERLDRHLKNREPYCEEYRVYRKDGTIMYWSDTGIAQWDEGKTPYKMVGVITNNTERVRADEALREASEFNRQIITCVKEGILVCDREFRIVLWNPFMKDITGLEERDILGKYAPELFPFLQEQGTVNLMEKVMVGECATTPDYPYQVPDSGHSGWAASLITPLRNSKGEIIGTIAVVHDITERKNMEQEVKALKEFNESIIEQSPVGIHFVDRDFSVRIWNSYFEEYTDIKKEDILGKNLFEVVPGIMGGSRGESYLEAMATGKATGKREYKVVRSTGKKKGTIAYQNLQIVPVEQGGDIIGVFTLFEDITERKQVEELNRNQRDLGLALSTATGLEEVLSLCLEASLKSSGLECGGVYLVDKETGGLILARHSGLSSEFIKVVSNLGKETPNTQLVMMGNPTYACYSELGLSLDDPQMKEGLKAIAVIPVKHEGEVIACLNVASKILDEVPAFSRQALENIGAQIGGAIAVKKADLALRESEERYRLLFEKNLAGVYRTTLEGQVIDCNESFVRLLGYDSKEEVLKHPAAEFYFNEVDRKFFIAQLIKQGSLINVETILHKKDNTPIWTLENVVLILDEKGAPAFLQGTMIDITEWKQITELQSAVYRISQAVERTESLDELYHAVHEIIQSVMPADNFYIALYNDKEEKIYFPYYKDSDNDAAPPRKLGKGLTDYVLKIGESQLISKSDMDELDRQGKATGRGKQSEIWLGVPLKIEKKTIGVMTVQDYSNPKAYGQREQHMLEFVSNQVAKAVEHKRAEEALKESEGKYRTIIENSLEGIYITQQHELKFCNRRFAEMFGFKDPEEANGRSIQDLVSPKSWNTVDIEVKARESGRKMISHYNFFARRTDGTEFEVETLGSRIIFQGKPAVQGVMRDISEQRHLEAQLRHAQKMEAVGRLAGGVAHDFNNLLTAIIGHSDMALMSLSPSEPSRVEVVEVQNAAKRAANLTRQLLAFSRKQTLEPKIIDLNSSIKDLEKMLRRIIGENIELITLLSENLWSIKVDTGQLEQIIVNLVVNASDAMPSGGRLTIETMNMELDEGYADIHPEGSPGSYVMLAVSDTGLGMTEEVKARIFEPFFTTKEVGRGTGLGLATVYGIAKQSGGHVWVYSEVGKGTSFHVYLPRAMGKTSEKRSKTKTLEMPRGNETLLVVEDEHTVRDLAVRTLKKLGYLVMEAREGEEALAVCQKLDKPADLIITDVIMPKMGGAEFVERVRKQWHDVKVIYMSGYAPDGVVKDGMIDSEVPFLRKPFRLSELAQKVREELDK